MAKKLISVLLVLTLAFCCFAGCGNTNGNEPAKDPAKENAETVKIGLAIPNTGGLAAFMVWFKVGVQMAVDEVNEAGGIDGKQVEIVIADIGDDQAVGVQRLNELKEQGCVAIVEAYNNFGVPWAAQNKIPVILGSNISTEDTIVNFNDYAFFCGLNAWGLSKTLALETVGKQGFDSFVFVGVDQACTVDAENLLIYEGQKLNPDFHMISSYRMSFDDDNFANIVSTIMALPEQPDMVLQQGGGPNFTSFAEQASLYGLFEYCDAYNDLTTDASTASSLVDAGIFPYGETHGIALFRWWDTENEEIQNFTKTYQERSKDLNDGTSLNPSDSGYTLYLGTKALLKAIAACAEAGKDYTDGDVLKEAMLGVKWSDSVTGEHYFRDFDHMLTYDAHYVTSADGGEEFDYYPIGADEVKYTAEEYLPSLEDMKIYAEQLGHADRFA